jgi:hypothetical protein
VQCAFGSLDEIGDVIERQPRFDLAEIPCRTLGACESGGRRDARALRSVSFRTSRKALPVGRISLFSWQHVVVKSENRLMLQMIAPKIMMSKNDRRDAGWCRRREHVGVGWSL